MHRLYLVVTVAVLATALCSLPGSAISQEPTLEIRPILPAGPQNSGEVIEIPTDDIEEFQAHIYWPGHEGEQVHITEVSWSVEIEPPDGAESSVIDWLVGPSTYVEVCTWFPWNVVHTTGQPCTYLYFQADISFEDASGALWGPIWSNTICKHIVPEPASFAALGIGLLTAGRLFIRKRR